MSGKVGDGETGRGVEVLKVSRVLGWLRYWCWDVLLGVENLLLSLKEAVGLSRIFALARPRCSLLVYSLHFLHAIQPEQPAP